MNKTNSKTQEIKVDQIDIYDILGKEMLSDIEADELLNSEELKPEIAKPRNMLLRLLSLATKPFFKHFKVVICFKWDDKTIAQFTFPKN